jgi:hypothetical protein
MAIAEIDSETEELAEPAQVHFARVDRGGPATRTHGYFFAAS